MQNEIAPNPSIGEVLSDAELWEMQQDCGTQNLPTQDTYWFRKAIAGEGPHAYDWSDKPHRLVFDLCRIIERDAAALRSGTLPSGVVDAIALEAARKPFNEAGAKARRMWREECLITDMPDALAVGITAYLNALSCLSSQPPIEPVGWKTEAEWALEQRAFQWNPKWTEEETRELINDLWRQYCLFASPKTNAVTGVTDEMVERACEKYAHARYGGTVIWPRDFSPKEISEGRENMRAAITAALASEPK